MGNLFVLRNGGEHYESPSERSTYLRKLQSCQAAGSRLRHLQVQSATQTTSGIIYLAGTPVPLAGTPVPLAGTPVSFNRYSGSIGGTICRVF